VSGTLFCLANKSKAACPSKEIKFTPPGFDFSDSNILFFKFKALL